MCLNVYNLLGGNPPYDDEERKHWFPVAMGVEGVRGFPATWILDCEKDCMRDDGRVLEEEMREVRLRVQREVVRGMPHYHWAFPLPGAVEEFWGRIERGIEWVLQGTEE